MRKMTQQLINRMMGSVEVNINSSQDKTFLAVDSVSDLREKYYNSCSPVLSVFSLPCDRLRVQVPHDWYGLDVRGV